MNLFYSAFSFLTIVGNAWSTIKTRRELFVYIYLCHYLMLAYLEYFQINKCLFIYLPLSTHPSTHLSVYHLYTHIKHYSQSTLL